MSQPFQSSDFTADPGSYRDPRSRVFVADGQITRRFTQKGHDDFTGIADSDFFRGGVGRGDIVDTWLIDEPVPDPWVASIGHAAVPIVSYPFEWTFSMLRDAARLQLRLLREGLAQDVRCKDGTAYNVFFDGARPVFIDVGSFSPLVDGEPWPGYRQFCQTYLNPLLIQAYLGLPFQNLLRGSLDGITPGTASAMLRGRARTRPGVVPHVVLHARAVDRYGGKSEEVSGRLSEANISSKITDGLASRLERLLDKLVVDERETAWSDYGPRTHYSRQALSDKEAFVADALGRRRWTQVLDLGCNDGRFSRIAAEHAEHVVSTDVDEAVVDTLYRTLRDEPGAPTNITPLVADVVDPSPPLGWRLRERSSFDDRVRPEMILCLALVHHLAVGRVIPLVAVVEYLRSFGAVVVVEFPHADDPMVQVLAGGRGDARHPYGLAEFEQALRGHFTVERRLDLPGMARTMFELSPAGV